MLRNQLTVEIAESGGRSQSKVQNIDGLPLFSDLMKVCKSDLNELKMIVDVEKSEIYVVGTLNGKTERITAIVDEKYNIEDTCYNQDLFAFKPRIVVKFELYRVNFHFMGDDKCGYDCSIRYLVGSKLLGEAFIKEINVTKERLLMDHKLSETRYTSYFETGFSHETLGVKSDNCVVFIVNPSVPFKPDILGFMDHSAPMLDSKIYRAAILFRNTSFLKTSLQDNCDEDLTDGNIYLALFKKGVKKQAEAVKHGSAPSTGKPDGRSP